MVCSVLTVEHVTVTAFACRAGLDAKSNKKHLQKCWAHSPLRAAARRLFYIAIHQVSLMSNAATVARRLHIDVHNIDNNDNDNNDNA